MLSAITKFQPLSTKFEFLYFKYPGWRLYFCPNSGKFDHHDIYPDPEVRFDRKSIFLEKMIKRSGF
jgi:hypothetical protein